MDAALKPQCTEAVDKYIETVSNKLRLLTNTQGCDVSTSVSLYKQAMPHEAAG